MHCVTGFPGRTAEPLSPAFGRWTARSDQRLRPRAEQECEASHKQQDRDVVEQRSSGEGWGEFAARNSVTPFQDGEA